MGLRSAMLALSGIYPERKCEHYRCGYCKSPDPDKGYPTSTGKVCFADGNNRSEKTPYDCGLEKKEAVSEKED